MQSTIIQCTCVSKKQKNGYYGPAGTINHEIELAVPSDSNNVFFQMSGGTNFVLHTINQEAAAMFELDKVYEIAISPVAPK